jgi:DNA ligase-1
MTLPVLYKKTNTGAIQYWRIEVIEHPDHSVGYDIWTHYGQVDGKEQRTVDSIFEGKNIGKANETSPKQQAEAEALAKWEKQKKKGYVESVEAAQADEVDALIEGGVNPMLAQSFSKHAQKIKYPCFAQPKLDGHRCIAIVENGKATLWSRTRKTINSMPHIVAELERMFPDTGITLDGELYNHAYRTKFEELTSLIRKEEPAPGHEVVQYHVYDIINDKPFDERSTEIETIFADGTGYTDLSGNKVEGFKYCKMVATFGAFSDENVTELFAELTSVGYEGIMLRNGDGKYVGKRSYDLQKVKEFQDDEFDIVGVTEGRGKLAGHAIFVCVDSKGDEFEAKLKGETSKLKEFFDKPDLWQGKKLTVQYQGLTGAKKVPRFPVGLRLREDV